MTFRFFFNFENMPRNMLQLKKKVMPHESILTWFIVQKFGSMDSTTNSTID
jgi:hypothetical protein